MSVHPNGYVVLVLVLMSVPASAGDAATVKVSKSAEYGQYLTDANGRSLYLFESDTQGGTEKDSKVSCSGDCIDRWPLFYTEGKPLAEEKADASKLGTTSYEGETVVTYNGWPLYYFVEDTRPGDVRGQDIKDFGGEWYLITPEGEKAEN